MIGRSSNVLGVTVSESAIACAELSVSGGKRELRRTATFPITAELSFNKPEALGQALAAFLRQKRFSASRAAVGVPARWLIAVSKELPPADEQAARSALRLQAE